jgi:hypothetical protein
MPEAKFDNIEEAFQFVVKRLVPKKHCYIVNVRGPGEIAKAHAATVQVVAENMVYENGEVGLTVHLPFDPASGTFQELVKFVGTDLTDVCDEYKYDGIPCFALRVGTDVWMAEKVLRFILLHVYGYGNLARFECEVYDEGLVNQ